MASEHDALIEDWRRNAAKHEDRNFCFLRSLKMAPDPGRIDLARDLHADAFGKDVLPRQGRWRRGGRASPAWGAAVAAAQEPKRRHPQGTHGYGGFRGVEPGRQDACFREQRPDDQVLGREGREEPTRSVKERPMRFLLALVACLA